jgi:hypothetical protein
MKTKTNLIILIFLIVLTSLPVDAQTIHLIMSKAGLPSAMLDAKKLTDGQSVRLPFGTGLTISLSEKLKGNSLITIKGADESSNLKIDDLQKALSIAPLKTDEQLQLTLNSKTYSLNEAFSVIFVSSKNHNKSITVTFDPAAASAGGSSNSNKNIKDDNQQQKEPPVYHAGSAVYDALSLADPAHLKYNDLKAIIKAYFPDSSAENINKIVSAVSSNPFLRPIIKPAYVNSTIKKGSPQSAFDMLSSLSMSAVGGMDVTKISDGLAKFLVKRVKEELSIAFFQRLKDTINKRKDLITLFPQTVVVLNKIDAGVYDYKGYIQNLREAFKADIETLDTNLPGLLPLHPKFFIANHVLADAIISGSYLTSELKKQTHPGDILANFPLDTIKKYEKNKTWLGTVQVLQLLSQSFRDTASVTSNTYWANLSYLRRIANDKKSLQIFLGLVYQQALNNYNSIPFSDNVSLITILDDVAKNLNNDYSVYTAYKLYFMQFAVKTDAINKMVASYQKPANDSLAVELYKKYFDAATDLFRYSIQFTYLPGMDKTLPDVSNFKKQYPGYLKTIQGVSDLAVDINRRNYSGAINQTANIFNLINKLSVDTSKMPDALVNNFVKYGSFIAAVATAKTSDEVETAIEAFALPVGSYSVKRESSFNVAINAYTGLFIGHESIQGIPSKQFFNSYGLTAPIGVSLSLGHRKFFNPFSGEGHASYSLFLSLIDIGAVAAYRFKDDTTAQVPKIQLKNIFSPGAFISIGIPKTPLSLNFGAQMGPNLRKIDNNNSTEPSTDSSNRIYWRFSAGLVVDIPLLNLHTLTK